MAIAIALLSLDTQYNANDFYLVYSICHAFSWHHIVVTFSVNFNSSSTILNLRNASTQEEQRTRRPKKKPVASAQLPDIAENRTYCRHSILSFTSR